jgi:heptosyltransferase II
VNILVISLAGIGDTLFTTPLIHELRLNFPTARIDAFVLWNGARDVLVGNPHLNSLFQKDLIRAGLADSLRFVWQLRKQAYDVSLNTHPQSRVYYRMIARFIGARQRLSHDYDHASVLDRLLVNRTLPQDYERHSIENNLALMGFIGAKPALPRHDYELFLAPAELAWADEFLAAQYLSGRKLLGIHVGSGATKNLALRRWPLAAYIELVKRVNRTQPEVAVLLFGGPEEEKDNQRILAETDLKRVFQAKTANLRQTAALIKKCHLFLSVDTALMHLAAAMKVPGQVVIETPTWNTPIHPYNHPFTLVQNPAVAGRNLDFYRYDGHGIKATKEELLRCMEAVSVDAVFKALARAG